RTTSRVAASSSSSSPAQITSPSSCARLYKDPSPAAAGWLRGMGRPRGKAKRPTTSQATKNQDAADAGSGDEEAVIPAYKRRGGRPQRRLKDKANDADEEEDDGAMLEPAEDSDGAKPAVPVPGKGSAENRGSKRRRRQPKRVFEPATERDEHPAKQSGFRHHGSRRKSTPRRAAEAGVECK
ncbi:hypothetical protein U9M48_014760, partial [Paspalum notatum var. saurae]